jgi:hypothetical protein
VAHGLLCVSAALCGKHCRPLTTRPGPFAACGPPGRPPLIPDRRMKSNGGAPFSLDQKIPGQRPKNPSPHSHPFATLSEPDGSRRPTSPAAGAPPSMAGAHRGGGRRTPSRFFSSLARGGQRERALPTGAPPATACRPSLLFSGTFPHLPLIFSVSTRPCSFTPATQGRRAEGR